ncbi:CU044_5270 family protein [Streptomyces sp. NPDC000594]|uniref:CU044_5270 family protein n=1 Tax=Streptomyces sp. NPDC000594 TaxID=3154261 RepID=UPI00331EA635
MNRTPWRRQEPLDHAELARLLPAPGEPDLPGDRRYVLEEHLMREIQRADTRTPATRVRRSLLVAVPVTALALAGVVLTGVLGGPAAEGGKRAGGSVELDSGTSRKVAATVALISDAAARRKIQEPRDGQFLYTRATVSSTVTTFDGDGMRNRPVAPHTREDWNSPDGRNGWYIEEGVNAPRGEPLGEGEPFTPSVEAPTYGYLKTLPTDPDALLAKIYRDTEGSDQGRHEKAFTTIGDLLRGQIAPPRLSAALYRAAAKIPGVRVIEGVEDGIGRDALAIARHNGGVRSEWHFDPVTYEHLGERSVALKGGKWHRKGAVLSMIANRGHAVVDEKGERPGSWTRRG